MRKFILVLTSLFLSLSTLQAAHGVEVSGGAKDVGDRDQATNGTVSAVVWGKRQNNDESKIFISYKREGSAWTSKSVVATLTFTPFATPQVAVTEAGEILVAWLDEENVKYRSLPAGETSWMPVGDVPDSSVTGQWFRHLDVVANGESITIAGVRSLSNSLQYVTWTSADDNSPWIYEVVGNAMNTNVFGSCKKSSPEACNYSTFEVKLVTNSAGNQLMSWMTYRETNRWKSEMKGSTFGIFVARRSSPDTAWASPVKIDSITFKEKVNFYAYFIGSSVLTEGGKAAISWMSGYNANTVKIYASVSAPDSTTFTASDKPAFAKAYEANRIKLAAVGENIWAAYEWYSKRGVDAVVKVGKLGDIANAKTWSAGEYYFQEITSDGTNPVILASGESAGVGRKVYKSVKNGANWSAPAPIMTLDSSADYVSDVYIASRNGTVVITAVGHNNTVWGIGIEVALL